MAPESVAKIRNTLLSFEYIMKENKHLNLNLIFIIVKYVSIYIRSFKRSKYFIRAIFFITATLKQHENTGNHDQLLF
jgi:hypothetical protein